MVLGAVKAYRSLRLPYIPYYIQVACQGRGSNYPDICGNLKCSYPFTINTQAANVIVRVMLYTVVYACEHHQLGLSDSGKFLITIVRTLLFTIVNSIMIVGLLVYLFINTMIKSKGTYMSRS